MKKNIPKWKLDKINIQDNYNSKLSQKVMEKISNIYNTKENLDELNKYLLIQSYFNKYFYDLKLINETNV